MNFMWATMEIELKKLIVLLGKSLSVSGAYVYDQNQMILIIKICKFWWENDDKSAGGYKNNHFQGNNFIELQIRYLAVRDCFLKNLIVIAGSSWLSAGNVVKIVD